MDLFDVLHGRLLVLQDPEHRQIYTWNRSVTLQCWDLDEKGQFTEVAIRTLSEQPSSAEQAMRAALKWCDEAGS